jgi:hypothetical protein
LAREVRLYVLLRQSSVGHSSRELVRGSGPRRMIGAVTGSFGAVPASG